MRLSRLHVLVLVFLLVAGVATVGGVVARGAGVYTLSPETLQINDELTIRGPNRGALRQGHFLLAGGKEVSEKAFVSWTDEEIRFRVRTDPGVQQVVLQPADESQPAKLLGEVTVLKYRLPPEAAEIVPGRIAVRLAPLAGVATVALGKDVFKRIAPDAEPGELAARWYGVEVPVGEEVGRIQQYAALPLVELAEYVSFRFPVRAPNDPQYGQQTNVRQTRLTAGWEARTSAAAVAILDTGVRSTHEELTGRVTVNRDFTGTGTAPCDGHGTEVASVAAAATDNGRGIAGAGWAVGSVGSYKVGYPVSGPECQITSEISANAIDAAWRDGFRVINMSYGYPRPADVYADHEQAMINNAWNAGVFLVAAAGNDNTTTPLYPAYYDNVYAVASVAPDDTRSSFSNYGGWVDFAAPGEDIPAASNGSDSDYQVRSGTSYAAPLVSGAAALLQAQGLTNQGIARRLGLASDAVDWDPSRSGTEGRLNAYRALRPSQGCIRDVPDGAWVQGEGRTDLFSWGSDDQLWHRYYNEDTGRWSSWEALGGVLVSGAGVSSWAEGRLDVFLLGTDNKLRHKYYEQGQGWSSGYENLGAPPGLTLTSDPDAVSWGNGRIDVFARGSDNQLWHLYYDGRWHDWEALGGVLDSGPTVSSWADGRLDVFLLGTDKKLRQKYYERGQGWSSGFTNLGAPPGLTLNSDPDAVSWAEGRIDVFVRGSNNALWQLYYDGGWSTWGSLGGTLTSASAVSSWGIDSLDVFLRGGGSTQYHKWFARPGPGWFGFDGLGAPPGLTLKSSPDSVSWSRARIFQVSSGRLREVPDETVLESWNARGDLAPICPERLSEFSGGSDWGYRPGRLVRDGAAQKTYLITTDGADRGRPIKRWVTSGAVQSCFGWSNDDVMAGTAAALALHPTGEDVTTCQAPLPRVFPNGTIIRAPDGTAYVIENGLRRKVANNQVFNSWFEVGQEVTASDVEVGLLPPGEDWGFRPGKIIKESGSTLEYFVTDDGLLRARGSRRLIYEVFMRPSVNQSERGLGDVAVQAGVPSSVMGLHAEGSLLEDADTIP